MSIKFFPIFLCSVNKYIYKPFPHHGYGKWQPQLAEFLLPVCSCKAGHRNSSPGHNHSLSHMEMPVLCAAAQTVCFALVACRPQTCL